ncbi:MAG: DNA-binding protein [Planctomycetes bacterium]|nr:DNA-binding protein [Planctomycetota bacterium]
MRVFLDANVLFSASNAGSNIARLVDWLLARATAVTSDLAREEARRNLAMKRPDWLPAFEQLIQKVEEVPSALFGLTVSLDEKDRPLLCAAIRAKCTHFATGDRRDFGHLFGKAVEQVQVVDLLGLAKLLAAKDT